MDIFFFLATFVVVFGLIVLISSEQSKQLYSKVFGVLCVSVAFWIWSNFFANHLFNDLTINDFFNKLAFVSGYLVIASGCLFTYLFPVKRKTSRWELIGLGSMALITIVLSTTPFIAGHVVDLNGRVNFTIGPYVLIYFFSFVSLAFIGIRNLVRLPTGVAEKAKKQARLITYAFLISALLGVSLNIVVPLLGFGWELTKLSPIIALFFVTIIAYAIIKHGLFDIRLAAVRTVAYILSLLTMAAIYFSLAYTASATMFKDNGSASATIGPFNIILSLIIAFLFQPIKQFFDRVTNKIFFRDQYDTNEFIARLGDVLTSTVVLRELLARAADEIRITLNASYVTFVVYKDDNVQHLSVCRGKGFSSLSNEQLDEIKKYLPSLKGSAYLLNGYDMGQKVEAAKILQQKTAAITLPLMRGTKVVGVLLLGQHKGRGYAKRDLAVLSTISNELVIAIQNAKSVEQVQDINKHLEQRINEATKELRSSNSKLQKLDKAKDEFISLTSHQLRTPLTSVKGYISMVLEGDAGKVTQQQKTLLEEAYNSSERMVHLIGDFLNVSRLQTGKFIIDSQMVDLCEVVRQEIEVARPNAESRSIHIAYRAPRVFPLVALDESKTRQVIMNFIDNAVYYSHAGDTIKIRLSIEDGEVVLTVRDNGIGVPEAVQSSLFEKFFRADNARRQRPDGTGIGLYLSKKIIVAQGGSIIFESKENAGSIFGFRLPLEPSVRLRAERATDQA